MFYLSSFLERTLNHTVNPNGMTQYSSKCLIIIAMRAFFDVDTNAVYYRRWPHKLVTTTAWQHVNAVRMKTAERLRPLEDEYGEDVNSCTKPRPQPHHGRMRP